MLNISQLKCEYFDRPIGLDVKEPRISWQITSDKRNTLQSAYHLQVSKDEEFASFIWDSGKVKSEQSIHVRLHAFPLEKRTRYYYRVKVWSRDGGCSEWSAASFWETGLLESNAWQADWITADDQLKTEEAPKQELSLQAAEAERCPYLRRTFHVKPGVRCARMYATALGLYILELNGQKAGDAYFTPGWTSYNHRLQYQAYDVTDRLSPGQNALGAMLGNGWYMGELAWSDQKAIYGDTRALLLQLHITYEDGSEDVVCSDEHWKSHPSPILMSELYHGELYDARLRIEGWSKASLNDETWQNIRKIHHAKHMVTDQENEPVRNVEEIQPTALITTPRGETVIDFGQNLVGWVRFTIRGVPGQEVTIEHAEVLDAEGNFYTDNLRKAKQTVTYRAKGEAVETYEPHFSFQGFRYIRLTGFPESVQLQDFTGVVLHSDMERTGFFECSDPLLNQLQHNIEWGQKGNFLDVPTDCPQRDERLGWTGDAQMFIRTASFLTNVAPFFTKWLRDLQADQRDDGGVPFVIPQVLDENSHSSAAWGDAAVICPWTLYLCYGDTRILEDQYESMTSWIDYIRSQGEQEYLWNTGFHFGDWLALDSKPDEYIGATDRDCIATAFYAYSTSIVAKIAKILCKQADYEKYDQLHRCVVEAFRREFVTPSGRLAVPTQTAQILALMFELVEGKAKERAEQKLIELLEQNDVHLTTGFVGTPYLNRILSRIGRSDIAYKLLFQTDFPSWLYQVTKGATTIWEHWDGMKEDGSFWSKDMNSFNHYAYGSIGEWLYSCVAGIDTDEEKAGYKHSVIKPQIGQGLQWASASLNTMYGTIRSEWRKTEDNTILFKIQIPPNTQATVYLPADSASNISEGTETDAVPVHETAGIRSAASTANEMVLTVGSGDYQFTVSQQQA